MNNSSATLVSIVEDLRANGPSTSRDIYERLKSTGVTRTCVRSRVDRALEKGCIVRVGEVHVSKAVAYVYALPESPEWEPRPSPSTLILEAVRESEHPMTVKGVCEAVGIEDANVVRCALHRLRNSGLVTSRWWFGNVVYWEAVASVYAHPDQSSAWEPPPSPSALVLDALRSSDRPMTSRAVCEAVGTESADVVRCALYRLRSKGLVTSRRWFGNVVCWEAVA